MLTDTRITSLFTSLCIHVISIRRDTGVNRRIAENRAQMCLICLKEVQKYWRINNNVLDIFFQYLDASLADRLHAKQLYAGNVSGEPPASTTATQDVATSSSSAPAAPSMAGGASLSMPWQQQQQQQLQTPAQQMQQEPSLHGPMLSGGMPSASTTAPEIIFDDQYFTNLMNGHWEADEKLSELGLFLQAEDITAGRGWR